MQQTDIPVEQMSIKVEGYQTRSENISVFTTFFITGSNQDGPFSAYRRFKQFAKLRKVLIQSWPSCYIPSLPLKKSIGNKNKEFISKRMKLLDQFCNEIFQRPFLFNSNEFRTFLSNSNGLDNISDQDQKQNIESIMQKYQQCFPTAFEVQSDFVQEKTMTDFIKNLQHSLEMMNNFKQMAKNSYKNKLNYQKEFLNFIQFMMPEYENNCIGEYIDFQKENLPFSLQKMNQIKLINQDNQNNCYDILYNEIKKQIADIHALNECLQLKGTFDIQRDLAKKKEKELQLELQKILAGKVSFTKLFKSSNKEQQCKEIENKIAGVKSEVFHLEQFCNVLSNNLYYNTIKSFKNDKKNEYISIVKRISLLENSQLKNVQQFWSTINDYKEQLDLYMQKKQEIVQETNTQQN